MIAGIERKHYAHIVSNILGKATGKAVREKAERGTDQSEIPSWSAIDALCFPEYDDFEDPGYDDEGGLEDVED